MGISPFKMPGMTFKEGQTPMKKISLKKVLGKVTERVEGKIKNVVENVKTKVGNVKDFISDASNDDVAVSTSKSTPVLPDTPDLEDISPVVKKSPTKIYSKPKGKRTEY